MRHLALALLSLTLCAAAVEAQTPSWKAEFLGAPQPEWSTVWAVAVNDAGTVVGSTYLSGYKRAWIASPDAAPQLLPMPVGATWAEADDMNADGVVAGHVWPEGGGLQAVVWRPGPGGYEVLIVPDGPGGQVAYDARGINDAGDVVGKLGVFGGSYVWDVWSGADEVTQIPTQDFPVVPEDINNPRQIVGDTYRMDLDTMVLENLGSPTGTPYNYMFTKLSVINDAGECAGYGVAATSENPYLPVRYTDGAGWTLFANFPLSSANALALAGTGDTVVQLGIYGLYVYVDGFGSIGLQSTLDATSSDWDLTDSFAPAISPCGLLACTGTNPVTQETGVVLLTPVAFEDLRGASAGELGDPLLTGYGSLAPGDPVRVRFANGAPGSASLLALSVASDPVPLFGGVFHANPALSFVPVPTDGLGRWQASGVWPTDAPAGLTVYLQVGVTDPASPFGTSLSNGLEAVTQ